MNDAATEIFLQIGQFHFGSGRTRLQTLLGSCVAFTFWHRWLRMGGMCHCLLPTPMPEYPTDAERPALYASGAVALFEQAIDASGTSKHDYVVQLIGGGAMFAGGQYRKPCGRGRCSIEEHRACRDVGCKNVVWSRELLQNRGFSIEREDVGGVGSRSVRLDLWSGAVSVRRGPPLAAPVLGAIA